MVDGLKMIHDSWIPDAFHHKIHERVAANNEIQFRIWKFIFGKWKRFVKLLLNFFHSRAAGFHSEWFTQRGFEYDTFGYHSARVREKRKIVDSISCAVWWELKTHWDCYVWVASSLFGLFTLVHQRKMLTLCSWERNISHRLSANSVDGSRFRFSL